MRWMVRVAVLLLCAMASLAASVGRDGPELRLLQMNLCNSGDAACYTGQEPAQAAALIRAQAPDVVTLNEICESDLDALGQAVADAHDGRPAVSGFEAATSRRTGAVVRCRNGSPYGIGIVADLPSPVPQYAGVYPMQENRGEQRAWLCLGSASLLICTTHLADDTPSVALAQCQYLLTAAIPQAQWRGPMVVGGDLNLSPVAAQPCAPAGYARRDDGAVQEFLIGGGLAIGSSKTIDMHGATDHPALMVALR